MSSEPQVVRIICHVLFSLGLMMRLRRFVRVTILLAGP